jgi:hypothetical protein
MEGGWRSLGVRREGSDLEKGERRDELHCYYKKQEFWKN